MTRLELNELYFCPKGKGGRAKTEHFAAEALRHVIVYGPNRVGKCWRAVDVEESMEAV